MKAMRTSILSAVGFTALLAWSATAETRFSNQLVTIINDPEAALIRGQVTALEIGDPGGKVVITVKVDKSFLGSVADSINVQGYYMIEWRNDTKRPLGVTDTQGSTWYRRGDDVLLLVKPFAKDSMAAGRFCQHFVRFITKDRNDEVTFIQTGHRFPSGSYVKEIMASGRTPTLEELSAAADRSLQPDGTLKQTVSDLLNLRKN
jgi:hypothetical protein